MEKSEILEYLEKTELFSKWDLRQTEEMLNDRKSVPINELVERFVEIDKEYSGRPWNILQILAQIRIVVPMEERTRNNL